MIALRRRGLGANYEDFLKYLLTKDDETLRLTDAEIQDNILTMIIAGQLISRFYENIVFSFM